MNLSSGRFAARFESRKYSWFIKMTEGQEQNIYRWIENQKTVRTFTVAIFIYIYGYISSLEILL